MSIVITDTRNSNKGVLWKDLVQGEVYTDFEGDYLLYTEDDTLVSLVTAEVIQEDDYLTHKEFTAVKCKLEVYG